jgi:hypothetical protein
VEPIVKIKIKTYAPNILFNLFPMLLTKTTSHHFTLFTSQTLYLLITQLLAWNDRGHGLQQTAKPWIFLLPPVYCRICSFFPPFHLPLFQQESYIFTFAIIKLWLQMGTWNTSVMTSAVLPHSVSTVFCEPSIQKTSHSAHELPDKKIIQFSASNTLMLY